MGYRFTKMIFLMYFLSLPIIAQEKGNCFLEDFEPKTAVIPQYNLIEKPVQQATVNVTINSDTLGKISKYVFGNACAVWVGQDVNNPILLDHLGKLAPTLIRFPGGSWSNAYFWNKYPNDIPATIPDGTKNGVKQTFYAHVGPECKPTPDSYYDLRDQLGAQGLITINYAYARYGTSEKPAEKAAHLAADWVRYDNGRTKFWEIGNENSGPWEYGWQIDTTLNKDGQPEIINGEIYGKHFKIFVDSMKSAAKQIGKTIYIGGIVFHQPTSWNPVDTKWNEGFFKEIGDTADFYVVHNYFGSTPTAKTLLDEASSIPKRMIDFIHQDITKKNASLKPIAMTEYNMNGGDGKSKIDTAKISIVNGMQAVILFNELIKNNYGMSARWLIANWETDGMFYFGNKSNLLWNPRPDFYYTYYLQKFTGDHSLSTECNNKDILAYSSSFSSGETGVILINKSLTDQTVDLLPSKGVGDHYYVYSLTGGNDNGEFSLQVNINGIGPDESNWGPINDLENIPAKGYSVENEIKVPLPARSVQYIMIDSGNNIISSVNQSNIKKINQFALEQNYPNPFNPVTTIKYQIPSNNLVTLKIFNLLGEEVKTLVNEEKVSGAYQVDFNAGSLPSGVYLYRLRAGNFTATKKLMILK